MRPLKLILGLFICSFAFLDADERPNIIFFLTDDQRNDTLGCTGNPIVQTPTIDKLAREGVLFENSFCEVPICAASRATLFTGLSQRTHGFNFGTPAVAAKYSKTSYPSLLKKAGYRIGFTGKYGMKFEKGHGIKWDYSKPYGLFPAFKKQKDGSLKHETELCGDAAIEFIDQTPKDQPFCMLVSFNAAHAFDGVMEEGKHFQWMQGADGMYEDVKIYPPKLEDEKYRDALPAFLKEHKLSRGRYFWRWDTKLRYEVNMRAYFRLISGIDMTMARVMKKLKEKSLHKNTIIIYSADNGYMMGDRGMAGKWNHYEQSLRVPLVIFDPRVPKGRRGRKVYELVNSIDIAPTIVSAAGVKEPEHYQGASLMPFVEGKSVSDWRDDIFNEHMFFAYPDWYSVRTERYKYATYYDEKDGPYDILFDLKKDPNEFKNLIAEPQYASVLKDMKGRMEHYMKAYPKVKYPEKKKGDQKKKTKKK